MLAAYQATEVDDWRDAEPGKILHELRAGEMAGAGELPHTPYYGSVDSTPLWLILLGATFDWTGDRALLDRLWPNALAALDWIDRYGDRDGDGFVEYERRSERGLLNQGWKDSSDAIRDRTGRRGRRRRSRWPRSRATSSMRSAGWPASPAIRGDDDLAEPARCRGRAAARAGSRRRSGSRTSATTRWRSTRTSARPMRSARTPASACGPGIVLAGAGRATSSSGCCGPAMFSGWGIRTYAAGPAGLQPDRLSHRDGLAARHVADRGGPQALRLRRRLQPAGRPRLRGRPALPRLPPAGAVLRLRSRPTPTTPVPYPVACSPQAWAAGASFLFLSTMLGLRAHADRGELELHHPHLPDWLGKVTLTDLRVGEASVDLLFHRWRGTTSAEVLRKVGDVAVTVRL